MKTVTTWLLAFLKNPFAIAVTVIVVDSIDLVIEPPPGLRFGGYIENALSGLVFYGMPPIALSFFTRMHLEKKRVTQANAVPLLGAWIGASLFSAVLLGQIVLDTPSNLLPWLPSTFLAGAIVGGVAGSIIKPHGR